MKTSPLPGGSDPVPLPVLLQHLASFAVAACLAVPTFAESKVIPPARPPVIVLTDFFKDPDDKQSMIRFLTCANELEVEGLIATSLAYGDGSVHPEWILQLLEQYGKVLPNLRQHERRGREYPSVEALKRVVRAGAPVIRKLVGKAKGFSVPHPAGARDTRSCDPAENWIGPGKDTPASEHIIQVVDRAGPRPVWVVVWGGPMDLAQALWKVRHERSAEDTARFVSKLRVYQVSWQDTGAVWIWNNFPQLFLLQSSESMRGIHTEGRPELRNEAWVDQNIRFDHGPLGAEYPKANIPGIKEGDTPSFLHLLAAGLGDPEHPEWGGWGGRFQRIDSERAFYVEAQDEHPQSSAAPRRSAWTVGRWNEATSRDFAARMDWCVKGFADANHHPLVHVDGDATFDVLQREAIASQLVMLDATGTHDPDGDAVDFRWWQYTEAGSCAQAVPIRDAELSKASFIAPVVEKPQTLHIILSVTDRGSPSLTSYRRVVFTIRPGNAATRP